MQLYTIGHSTYPVDHFLELIRKYNIQYVIDVRSIPYSRFASQYNSEVLKKDLRGINVEYFHMDKSFGARQTDIRYYNSDGYLDFELFRKSDAFIKGVQNIIKGLKQYNIALMCTEKKPIDCHRAIMVARGFELHGVSVQHILHDGSTMSQTELDQLLLDMYFPDRNQITLFDVGKDKNEEDYLIEAYRLRNKEIGYRYSSDKEGVND